MRQVIVDALGVEAIVIRDDGLKRTCAIAAGLDKALLTEKLMSFLPPQRAASLLITATVLAATSVSETKAEYVEPRASGHLAQATTNDPGASRGALEQYRAEMLARGLAAALATVRRDGEPQTSAAAKPGDEVGEPKQTAESAVAEMRKSLQQERERAGRLEQELTAAQRDVETQTALAAKAAKAAEKTTRDKQVAESTSAELQQSLQLERDRAEALTQEVSAARAMMSAYEAQARETREEAADLKRAAEGTAKLQKSLGQERERADRLEQELAAARRDLETQTALVKANEKAAREKQVADSDAAELQKSQRQERDKAAALADEVSAARAMMSAYEAQARKTSEEAADLKRAAEGAAKLQKSLEQERERADRLEQEFAAARRDVEMQTALAKANEKAAREKQVADSGAAELQKSLRQERDKAAALAEEVSAARAKVFAYEAQARKTSDETADLKRAAKGAAELQKSLERERERADRLEQELAAARRDVETQTALAKADEKAARERQVAESESAELRKSLQQERGRVTRLKRQLAFARSAKAAPAAPAVVATRFTPDKIREAEATGPQATTVAEARDGTRRDPAVRNARAAIGTTAVVGASALGARHANVARNANTVQRSLNARPISRALNNTIGLRDPRTRAFITANVATAAWQGGNWWWRHRNGGFGWVGPLFWPFAFYDIYDYAFWGYPYDDAFWGYGYPDLYAGIFGLYGYDDLMGYAGYLSRYAGRRGGNLDTYAYAPSKGRTSLARMCGDDSRVIAGLLIKAFQNAIQPNKAQRAALEELANASEKAAAGLKGSCPTDVALTAPGRLAGMQQRIEAMIVAVETVQGPLDKFYGLLSDEQKAQINALSTTGQRPARTAARAGSAGPACDVTRPELTEWPTATIEQSVRPTEQQRPYLNELQGAAAQAAETLKASCQTRPENAQTPPARLAAVAQRLNAMLQAVETVRMAMHDFYRSLTSEQKAAFERSVRSRLVGADTSAGAHNPADDVVCAVSAPQDRSCF